MKHDTGNGKTFLFLQGPHGPFFYRLGQQIRATGANVWRVGFNAGDAAFWPDRKTYLPYRAKHDGWVTWLTQKITELGITDLVLYGDTRPVHAMAVACARDLGLTIHVFEEGYMRPYWITYERNGSNGHSKIMTLSVADIRARLRNTPREMTEVPAHWGDMKQHIFYGALYHWFVLFANQRYSNFAPHRRLTVRQEFMLYLKRLALFPLHWAERVLATMRIKFGGFPYHLALLQLEHDASFLAHSNFEKLADFTDLVLQGFADNAPSHHHLVFKAHPLDDGRAPIRRDIREKAQELGVSARVHFVRGGKLAALLDHAKSAVTINSTAGQQALWRGLPLRAFGTAVYSKPEFVSDQALGAFFRAPRKPDRDAYLDFRQFLLETSQISGGFYSATGRGQALRQVVDRMLAKTDPYAVATCETAAARQQLRVV